MSMMAQQKTAWKYSLVTVAVLTTALILSAVAVEIESTTVDITMATAVKPTQEVEPSKRTTRNASSTSMAAETANSDTCEGTRKSSGSSKLTSVEKSENQSTKPNTTAVYSDQTEETGNAFQEEDDDEDDDDDNDDDDDEFWDEEEDYEEDEEEAAGPGNKFGVVQSIEEDDEATWDKLYEAKAYMEHFALTTDRYVNRRGLCRNRHELCTYWAANGECDANPVYMLAECGPACKKCTGPADGPGVEFGMVQDLDSEPDVKEAAVAKLAETERYMREMIWSDDLYVSVRGLCFNHDEKCTLWAVRGQCEENSGYMDMNCSPACGTCKNLHYDTRCAADPADPNVWEAGDLNRMFERIVATNFSHANSSVATKAQVLSRPDYVPGDDERTADYKLGPWVVIIDNFVTSQEAERLIYHGTEWGYERSTAVGEINEETGELESIEGEFRTSSNAWCEDDCEMDPIVKGLIDRIEQLTGIPSENSESFQLLKCKCKKLPTVFSPTIISYSLGFSFLV